jgi:hypothetical protein
MKFSPEMNIGFADIRARRLHRCVRIRKLRILMKSKFARSSMITIQATKVLAGYSEYGDPPVVIFTVTLKGAEAFGAEAQQRLRALQDRIGLHRCSPVDIGSRGAAPETAKGFAELLLVMQQQAMHQASRAIIEPQAGSDTVRVIVPCEEAQSCLYAGEVAASLFGMVPHADCGDNFLQGDIDDFLAFAKERAPDANTRLLRQAARRRGLPVIDLE